MQKKRKKKIIGLLQEELQKKSDLLAHETVRLQKPVTDNFRISLQIYIYDEYYSSILEDCNKIALKKGSVAAKYGIVYLLPSDFHILSECDSVINEVTAVLLNKIKDFSINVTFGNNESKLMLDLLGFERLKNYTVKEKEEKENDTFISSMYHYDYQLLYLKDLNCFWLDMHNFKLPIERRSDAVVSLNDLNNSTVSISIIDPDFLNQGPPINNNRKNFNKVEIRVGNLFCGEYILGGFSDLQSVNGKYVINNFKVSGF